MTMRGHKNEAVQGFAPNRIEVASNSLDTTGVLAIRVAAVVNYQINGAGVSAIMPIGITVINGVVDSLLFDVSTTVEVMDTV